MGVTLRCELAEEGARRKEAESQVVLLEQQVAATGQTTSQAVEAVAGQYVQKWAQEESRHLQAQSHAHVLHSRAAFLEAGSWQNMSQKELCRAAPILLPTPAPLDRAFPSHEVPAGAPVEANSAAYGIGAVAGQEANSRLGPGKIAIAHPPVAVAWLPPPRSTLDARDRHMH